MPSLPPVLPDKTLETVMRVGRRDGITTLAIAGAFALASALVGDRWGALVGLVIAGSGVVEIRGASLLDHGYASGVRWLIASQVYLMLAVIGYVIWRYRAYDEAEIRRYIATEPFIQDLLSQGTTTEADFLKSIRQFYTSCYVLVGVLTVFYQGAMVVYFQRRKAAIVTALADDEVT